MTITLGQAITASIAALALFVSAISLWVSALNYRRDRAKLIATCHHQRPWPDQGGEHNLKITILNAGRRPITIRLLGGREGNKTSATYQGKVEEGIELHEGKWHTVEWNSYDLFSCDPEGETVSFEELWVEDSLGKRHKVKGSRTAIRSLYLAEKVEREELERKEAVGG